MVTRQASSLPAASARCSARHESLPPLQEQQISMARLTTRAHERRFAAGHSLPGKQLHASKQQAAEEQVAVEQVQAERDRRDVAGEQSGRRQGIHPLRTSITEK